MPPIRGRAACNGCRTRKQKCDEKKPTCSRCLELNRTCIWPRAQKRGPVKGYMDALENRLQETEIAFLRLLSVVPPSFVHQAFLHQTNNNNTDFTTLPLSTLSEHHHHNHAQDSGEVKKSSASSFWQEHPLRTSHQVLSWADDALQRMGNAAAVVMPFVNGSDDGGNGNLTGRTSAASSSSPINGHSVMDHRQSSRGQNTPAIPPESDLHPDTPSIIVIHDYDETNSQTSPQESKRIIDLPIDFQTQYLW